MKKLLVAALLILGLAITGYWCFEKSVAGEESEPEKPAEEKKPEEKEGEKPAEGEDDEEKEPEKPKVDPPPAPAEKWIAADENGNYKLEYKDKEHPLKAKTQGYLATLRTYTGVPAPAEGKSLVAVLDTTAGKIAIKLYHKDAPQHTANMVWLAQEGFYKKTYSHRIIKGFMIQMGCPNTKNSDPADDGRGGAGYFILDEFSKTKKHKPGILSAASIGQPNSSGCQFFLMHGDASFLDGKYSIYGEVIEGMDIVNKVAETPCSNRPGPRGPEKSIPNEKTYINGVTIEER
ncbi:MAG: peptidylprolyl isomerase [Planctomycetota bacterium]|jgi:peptidyl-prolyl cis-trans isomerase B (cyclophilin B)